MDRCPTHNQLAALADGNLKGTERATVLQHVNACPRCFAIYRDTLEFTQTAEDAELVPFRPSRVKPAVWSGLALAAALLLALGLWWPADEGWRETGWWVEQQGLVSATDPINRNAQQIFERVHHAADDAGSAQLFLIEGAEPLALALKDGVVLSRAAYQLCYQDADRVTGDTRLALVLGHELAHFRQGEFEHAFAAYRGQKGRNPTTSLAADLLKSREIHADQWGLVFAAQAGFDPNFILRDADPFFKTWANRPITTAAFSSHPDAEIRAVSVVNRLRAIAANADLYHMGLRFYQMGRYTEALEFFRRFDALFPGREVANNMGLSSLQIALQHLADCDGALLLRFKLPLMVDADTLADGARQRGGPPASPCLENPAFKQHMANAVRLFKRALDLEPGYEPARINLASVFLVEGNAALAMNELADAPQSVQFEVVKALALYAFAREKDVVADQREAADMLRPLAENDSIAAYNRAVIIEGLGGDAGSVWRRFLDLEGYGPHADYARERLGLQAVEQQPTNEEQPPVPLGPITAETRAVLAEMAHKTPSPVDQDHNVETWRDGGLTVWAQADQVILVEQRLNPPVSLERLPHEWRRGFWTVTSRGPCLIGKNHLLETFDGTATMKVWFNR